MPLLVALALLLPSTAHARVYQTDVLADSEDELRLLYEDGLLTEQDFRTLVELYNNPLNINEASRNQLYDLPGLTLEMCGDIVAARRSQPFAYVGDLSRVPGLTPEIIEQLESFTYAEVEANTLEQVVGVARLRSVVSWQQLDDIEDDHANKTHRIQQLTGRDVSYPATYLTARARYSRTWEAGAVALAQEGVSQVSYNPDSRDFSAGWGAQVFQPAKAFAKYQGGHVEAILGSYGAGFGVGMTFDRTNRVHPEGFYADLSVNGLDNYSLPHQLFGGAVRVDGPKLGELSLVTTAFVSSQRYDIYQYDMGIAGNEPFSDPSELSSPRVYVAGQKVGYMTLPNAYRDSVAGVNVALNLGPRSVVGLTGYIGHLDRTTIEGVDGPNAWVIRSGYPTNDTYGAVGLHGAVGVGPVDFLAEGAVTTTGGAGVLLKAIATPGRGEVEASLRRYGTDFDNPHARGIAEPDEYEGFRDRDEQGFRLRTQYDLLPWLQVRGTGDIWQNISYDIWNINALGQVRFLPTDTLTVSLFAQRVDRNLAITGRSREYGGSFEDLYDGDEDVDVATSVDRAGTRNQLGVQAQLDAIPRVRLSGYYRRVYEDSALLYPTGKGTPCEFWYQIGQYAWVKAQVTPLDNTTVSARMRFMDEDVYGSTGDRFAEGYLEVAQTLPGPRVKLALRGTLGADLPDAPSEWKDACDLGGDPLLEGTCAVDPAPIDDALDAGSPRYYGMAWLKAEVRF